MLTKDGLCLPSNFKEKNSGITDFEISGLCRACSSLGVLVCLLS